MCVYSQNPHDHHSFHEVSLNFEVRNNKLCVATPGLVQGKERWTDSTIDGSSTFDTTPSMCYCHQACLMNTDIHVIDKCLQGQACAKM